MLQKVERVALDSRLELHAKHSCWTYDEEHPHISTFTYELATEDDDRRRVLGTADGYRITQDWSVESDLQLWDEADALDGDVVTYVEALIRELRAYEAVFDIGPELTHAQRITILRHVEAVKGVDSAELTQAAAACLAMMDAPSLMLVDPWPMSDERRLARGKLKGRSHVPKLLELGFARMVASRFVWAWSRELSEGLMEAYSYDKLVTAKRAGKLKRILDGALVDEVYGRTPDHVKHMLGVPLPGDIDQE